MQNNLFIFMSTVRNFSVADSIRSFNKFRDEISSKRDFGGQYSYLSNMQSPIPFLLPSMLRHSFAQLVKSGWQSNDIVSLTGKSPSIQQVEKPLEDEESDIFLNNFAIFLNTSTRELERTYSSPNWEGGNEAFPSRSWKFTSSIGKYLFGVNGGFAQE